MTISRSELRSCVKVEVAVLGFPVPNKLCVCVCVCACVRACVRASERACVVVYECVGVPP